MNKRILQALLALGAALHACPAHAQEDLDDVETSPVVAPAAPPGDGAEADEPSAERAPSDGSAPKKKDKDKNKDASRGELSFGGRVFVRAAASDTDDTPWQSQLSLESVRLGASYRWKKKLRAKLVIEAAGNVSIKDALLELPLGHGVALRAGRFKGPFSAIERASAWDLPSIGRGAVADILDDGLGLAGRRDALELSYRAGKRGPKLALVASQSLATTGDAAARPVADGGGVTVAARAEIELARGMTIGATGSSREVNYVAAVGRYWAGGADAEVDLEDYGLGLRAWVDVLIGESHLAAPDPEDPTAFFAAQLIAGWRFGGQRRDKGYLEPFARVAFLNPDLGHRTDQVLDLQAGLAGGLWKRWRAQLAFGNLGTWSRRPAGLGGFGQDINDAVEIMAQLGAAF